MEINTLYLGDCLEVMKKIPSNSVDCIVTDPPYFTPAVHYQSRVDFGKTWGDTSLLRLAFNQYLIDMLRILKPTGHLFVFCKDVSFCHFYPLLYENFDLAACLVWNKMNIGLGKIYKKYRPPIFPF